MGCNLEKQLSRFVLQEIDNTEYFEEEKRMLFLLAFP